MYINKNYYLGKNREDLNNICIEYAKYLFKTEPDLKNKTTYWKRKQLLKINSYLYYTNHEVHVNLNPLLSYHLIKHLLSLEIITKDFIEYYNNKHLKGYKYTAFEAFYFILTGSQGKHFVDLNAN